MYCLVKDFWLSENFRISEFACNNPDDSPKKVLVEMELVEKLERFRLLIGEPLFVASGYRTPEWNRKVGGSPHSSHLAGRAADIRMEEYEKDRIMVFAVNAGFRGIGFYDGFIHLDVRLALRNDAGRSFDLWDTTKK